MGRTSRLTFDPVLISSALALLLLGLVMVTSASISIADRELGSPFAFLERQLLFASVGCCLKRHRRRTLEDFAREIGAQVERDTGDPGLGGPGVAMRIDYGCGVQRDDGR